MDVQDEIRRFVNRHRIASGRRPMEPLDQPDRDEIYAAMNHVALMACGGAYARWHHENRNRIGLCVLNGLFEPSLMEMARESDAKEIEP